MRRAIRARLGARRLAEEVVLLDGGEAGVGVRRADQAELVRVRAELRLDLEAELERRARVLVLQHVPLLQLAEIEVALVPPLEAGELVVRREERMRLAVPLDLRGLVDALPARPGLGVLPVDRPAGERLDDGKHPAVAEVPVVGDREDLAAGLLLVGRHPLPEVPRVVAPVRLVDGERLDPARLGAVVPEDHVPVQVVAAGVRGPLVADERGEAARVVRLVRRLDRLAPGRAVGRRAGEEHRAPSGTSPGRTRR